jgi:hypothetical protein
MTVDQTLAWWNAVGTWVAGAATFLAICLSLYLSTRSETFYLSAERRRNAADLYTLFSTVEMERARGDAWAFLEANAKSPKPLSYEEIHRCSTETLTAVTQVIQFWERTAHFLEARHIDGPLAKRLLGHYFESHYQTLLTRLVDVSREKTVAKNLLQWTVAVEYLAKKWGVARHVELLRGELQSI